MLEQLATVEPHITRLRAVAELADDSRPARGAAASKVLTVLTAFGAGEGSLSLGELAKATDLPKSTVHRMVGFLRDAGLVEMVDSRFLLTSRVTELSGAVPTGLSSGMREVLLPTLTELYEATKEAVHFATMSGDVARVVERVHGRRSAGWVTRFRSPLPLHCTAAGKVMLAASPAQAGSICSRRLTGFTPATIVSGERLRAELVGVRRYGVAFDRGEWCPGITGVAAPVWGAGGALVGAVSVVGPAARLSPDAIARKVAQAADITSRELRSAGFVPRQQLVG